MAFPVTLRDSTPHKASSRPKSIRILARRKCPPPPLSWRPGPSCAIAGESTRACKNKTNYGVIVVFPVIKRTADSNKNNSNKLLINRPRPIAKPALAARRPSRRSSRAGHFGDQAGSTLVTLRAPEFKGRISNPRYRGVS